MRMFKLTAILLCFGAVAVAQEPGGMCETGQGKDSAACLLENRMVAVRESCRRRGLDEKEVGEILAPVGVADGESLPAGCILLRIEEGLCKKVSPADLKKAVALRLELLRKSDAMVMSARKRRGGQHQHLVSHVCMALESGVPEAVLQDVFTKHPQFRYGRMIHVIEAGETLQLAGVKAAHVQQVMNECLDRDLTRPEVFRVADYIVAEHRKGRNFSVIYSELWNDSE